MNACTLKACSHQGKQPNILFFISISFLYKVVGGPLWYIFCMLAANGMILISIWLLLIVIS